MKIDRDVLYEVLLKLSPIYEKGDRSDITGCVVFRPSDFPRASVFATRLTSSMSCEIEVDCNKIVNAGKAKPAFQEFAVNGKTLLGLLSKLDGVITVKDVSPAVVEFSCGRAQYEIQKLPTNTIPSNVIDSVVGSEIYTINAQSLKDGLHYGSRFTSKDQSRGALAGVNIVLTPDENGAILKVGTSDGYRAIRYKKNTSSRAKAELELVISKEQAHDIRDILEADDSIQSVITSVSNSKCTMMFGNYEYTFAQMAFKPVKMIFDLFEQQLDKSCEVKKASLSDAMSRIGKVQDDEYSRIVVAIDSSDIELRKFDISKGKARELVSLKSSTFNKKTEVYFTSMYLFSCYQTLDKCDMLTLSTVERGGDVTMMKVESQEKPEVKCIVVPVSKSKP